MFHGEGEYVTIPVISKPGGRVSIIMFLFLQFGCVFQDSLSAMTVTRKMTGGIKTTLQRLFLQRTLKAV